MQEQASPIRPHKNEAPLETRPWYVLIFVCIIAASVILNVRDEHRIRHGLALIAILTALSFGAAVGLIALPAMLRIREAEGLLAKARREKGKEFYQRRFGFDSGLLQQFYQKPG